MQVNLPPGTGLPLKLGTLHRLSREPGHTKIGIIGFLLG